jgi:hypothetical protein
MPVTASPPPLGPTLVVSSGPLIGELVSMVWPAYTLDELEQLARGQLDLDLFGQVCARGPTKDVTYSLITWLNRRGGLDRLVAAVGQDRPDLAPVLDAFRARARNESPAGQTHMVGQAIQEVAEAVRSNPEGIRAEVRNFRVRFEVARTELDRLARYKGLHECLHRLQLQYRVVMRTAAAFPTDPMAGTDLNLVLGSLGESVRQARGLPTGLLTAAIEHAWLDEYHMTLTTARGALRPPTPDRLKAAVRSLAQLLPEAVRINGEVHAAAARLVPELGCVADAINTLSKYLAAAASDEDPRVCRLRAGHQELMEVIPRLDGLVEVHNGWQQIDHALSLGAALPPGPPAERIPRWARVKTLLGWHCAPAGPEQPDPTDLAAQLEAAADPVAAEPLFQDLRAATLQEFAIVDADLLALTGELTADIIRPLDTLLGVI